MEYKGGCHCGNLSLTFSTAIEPENMTPIACQCSFCRNHNVLAIADPKGRVDLSVISETDTNRYRFGLETAEHLICRTCGVYVAALTTETPVRALIVVNCLDARDQFTAPPKTADYGNETVEKRKARRQKNWTPLLS